VCVRVCVGVWVGGGGEQAPGQGSTLVASGTPSLYEFLRNGFRDVIDPGTGRPLYGAQPLPSPSPHTTNTHPNTNTDKQTDTHVHRHGRSCRHRAHCLHAPHQTHTHIHRWPWPDTHSLTHRHAAEVWNKQLGILGSGSDFTVFLARLGIAATDFGVRVPPPPFFPMLLPVALERKGGAMLGRTHLLNPLGGYPFVWLVGRGAML
jgi:hypothetical protein